jgi:hypothetical protein
MSERFSRSAAGSAGCASARNGRGLGRRRRGDHRCRCGGRDRFRGRSRRGCRGRGLHDRRSRHVPLRGPGMADMIRPRAPRGRPGGPGVSHMDGPGGAGIGARACTRAGAYCGLRCSARTHRVRRRCALRRATGSEYQDRRRSGQRPIFHLTLSIVIGNKRRPCWHPVRAHEPLAIGTPAPRLYAYSKARDAPNSIPA